VLPYTRSYLVLFATALLLTANALTDDHRRGVGLYKQQKYAEAILALQQAIRTESPGTAPYQESALLIGQGYFLLSQVSKAIPWLEKVTTVREANYMLGYAYLQTGLADRSEAAFARVFGVDSKSPAAHLLAAQMMLKKEYENEARAEAGKALSLDPDLPQAHYLLALTVFRRNLNEAISELQKELSRNPDFSMAWYRLGDAYARQQHCDVAIPDLQRAVWLNPDYSGPYILLGKCYFQESNYSSAESFLQQALRLDPQNREATYLLGQTLIAGGHKEEGRALLSKLPPARN